AVEQGRPRHVAALRRIGRGCAGTWGHRPASEPDDFIKAFDTMDRERPDAILMVSDSLTLLNRRRVFEDAAERRLPAIYETDSLTREGGLMSYGPDRREIFERSAALVDRIFKGTKPADLQVEQPPH